VADTTGTTGQELAALLEEAWGIIANTGQGDWGTQSEQWREAAEQFRGRYHGGAPAAGSPEAGQEAPPSAGRLARVEIKGFRELGIVRVTEAAFAGEPVVHVERTPWSSPGFEGDAADFPASSLHFVTWLSAANVARLAAARPALAAGYDAGEDYGDPGAGDDDDTDELEDPF
jgi:hypothetical protein